MAKAKKNTVNNTINIKSLPVQCHVGASKFVNDDWGTIAFSIPRNQIQNKFADPELRYNFIYFLFGYENSKEVVYVGQAKKRNSGESVLARLREHDDSTTEKYRDKWEWIIAVTNKNDAWGLDDLNALEHAFYNEIPADQNLNGNNPNSGGADYDAYVDKISQIKSLITAIGFSIFSDEETTEKIQVTSEVNEFTIVEDLQNGMARIPEIVTPQKVVKSMVDMLPAEVWNSHTTFLDPACKGGEYLREIYDRLMETEILQSEFPDEFERSNHILSKQIYGIALSQVSLERTAKKLRGFDHNIRVIPNYIDKLKGFNMGSRPDGSQNNIQDILNKDYRKEMKIDVVIGNPPYQENDNGDGTSASAIYHRFIEMAINLSNNLVTLVVPSRWMSDLPRGINRQWLEDFRQRKDFKYLVDYQDSKDAFVGVNIAGGVCYFAIEKDFSGITHRIYKNGDTIDEWDAPLCINGDTIIRDKIKAEIAQKFRCSQTIDKYMSSKTPFQKERGTQVPFDTSWIMYSDIKDEENTIKYFTKQSLLGYGYISPELVEKGAEMVHLPKILLQTSAPTDGNVLNKPIYAGVNSTCASSWLVLCDKALLKNEIECMNCIKYIKSKTLRFLVSCVKSTQHSTKEVYKLVPIQDFTSTSDIDWSKSVDEIDQQLYKKYGLTQEEIDYIEKTIKPME